QLSGWRVGTGDANGSANFVTGLAKLDQQVVMLLDPERLLPLPLALQGAVNEADVAAQERAAIAHRAFARDASPEDQAVLRERARALATPVARDDFAGREPVAVTRLGQEFFGFELDGVREFAAVHTVTPVPCCPERIVGQVNLRGDIITLVDLRPMLRVPEEPGPAHFMVLVEIDAQRFGVWV